MIKAAFLKELGKSITIEEFETPKVERDTCLVKPKLSYVLNFASIILGGKNPMLKPPTPLIPGPGCVASVEKCDNDIYKKGELVFVTPWIYSQINRQNGRQDSMINGWFTMSPSERVMKWKNGSWCEKQVFPIENVYPIPEKLQKMYDLKDLTFINYYSIAYGALMKSGFKRGDNVLILGATGNLGSCCTHLAYYLGAKKISVVSRNIEKLEKKFADFEKEKFEFLTPKDLEKKALSMDQCIDFLGMVGDSKATEAGIKCLKPGGTIVFGGGVYADISINYGYVLGMGLTIKGSMMYDYSVPKKIIQLMTDGVLKIPKRQFKVFELEKVNEAVEEAFKDNQVACLLKMNE